MKKTYFSLFFAAFLLCGALSSLAQMVGTNCYLQGRYLEIGMCPNGAFGTCNPQGAIPAGYHPHTGATPGPSGTNLAEVYDWGKDGWAVGTPPFMGDYTYPGSPFEGWELQIGAGRVQAFQGCAGPMTPAGGMTMAGSHTGYTNIGGSARGIWTGTGNMAGATLAIRQETRVDTLGSAVIVTCVLRNTGAIVAPNVYYLRSCDPDNAQTWSSLGGGFPTVNRIVHQNEDARHRVLVKSYDQSLTEPKSYMGLGTKDCRAKCFIYNAWWLSSTVDLATVWNQTYGAAGSTVQYTLGACLPTSCTPQDIAIGLVYNIGNIAPGDSAVVSYAYIFDGDMGIDGAFPDPQLALNGNPRPVTPHPAPTYDTFDVCAVPGMTSLNVDILNVEDRAWTWSRWTWAPSLGLATTTGAHNVITTTALPPIITYTITGTDSAIGMTSCLNKVFYLTLITCNGAEANSPCVGDTLWVNAPGDSTGATYQWYGPAPSTSVFATTQRAFIYPTTAANAGTYSVIKTVAGVPDTSVTIVTMRHKPTVWASTNAPLCIGSSTPLLLNAVCDSATVTYSWTATPSPFTSSLANPSIPGFSFADTGIYRVIVSTVFGCKDTAEVQVGVSPVPPAPIVTGPPTYCQNDPFVPFTVSGLAPGASVLWYPTMVGGVGSITPPTVNTSVPGTYYFYFSQKVGSCEGPRDSISVRVNPIPAPIVGPAGVCQNFNITLTDATPGGVWSSSAPGIASINSSTGVVTGVAGGTANITYILTATGCRITRPVTIYPKPAPPTVTPIPLCQYKPAAALTAVGTSITWYGLGVTVGTPVAPIPNTDTVPGIYNYYLTQTSSFGCVSDSAIYPLRIKAEPAAPTVADLEYCQGTTAGPLTATGTSLTWYSTATSTPGTTAPTVPSTTYPGTNSYYVTQTVEGCESPRSAINVTVLVKPDFEIDPNRLWACQGDTIGLNYDGPAYPGMAYRWDLPFGASFTNGTTGASENIIARFDSVNGQHAVYLTVSSHDGKCFTTDSVLIKVIPVPNTNPYIKPDLCLGDTMTLALDSRSWEAYKFLWTVDGIPMNASPALNIISANSNSGGPYIISWVDTGLHIVTVKAFTTEGCPAFPSSDTVRVHANPVSDFNILQIPGKFCIDDSVMFGAVNKDYGNSYKWEPEHSFANMNKPEIWGRVEQLKAVITLTVTDPFGCKSTSRRFLTPDECCKVTMPNAFTPNGDGKNDFFRPMFDGFRRFHIFRISNRWGQTVFESTNNNPAWDGVYNGVPQDMGTYFYYIKYDCGGKTVEEKGDITLVR